VYAVPDGTVPFPLQAVAMRMAVNAVTLDAYLVKLEIFIIFSISSHESVY
jgi:hypothetical protein